MHRLRSALGARFDTAALCPPAPGLPLGPRPPCWPALQTWCLDALHAAAGPQRWHVATLEGADAARLLAAAQALCLQLDGSLLLQACAHAPARLALRLRVELQDAMAWRRPQVDDVWDSGWAVDTPAGRQALAGFEPRRPTLIVLQAPPTAALLDSLRVLAASSADWLHPVCLLVLCPADAAWDSPGQDPLTRLAWQDGHAGSEGAA